MPDFQRRTLAGGRVDTETLRGRVVVIEFFARYCEPCTRTLPVAEALHRELPDVSFIGVAIDERRSDVLEMVSDHDLTFPIVHDPGTSVAGRYRVTELPITFVAARDGTIRWVGGPDLDEGALRSVIEGVGARRTGERGASRAGRDAAREGPVRRPSAPRPSPSAPRRARGGASSRGG
jgi:peroxiredoxin